MKRLLIIRELSGSFVYVFVICFQDELINGYHTIIRQIPIMLIAINVFALMVLYSVLNDKTETPASPIKIKLTGTSR